MRDLAYVVVLCAIYVALVNIGKQVHLVAYQAALANCIVLAEREMDCDPVAGPGTRKPLVRS
jgi:hypothetical protein